MAAIIISRTNEYLNRMRVIGIYIDGKKVDVIKNGEIRKIEIEEGKHTLSTHIDWCGSNKVDFNIPVDETYSFKLASFKGSRTLFVIINIMLLCLIANIFVGEKYLSYGSLILGGLVTFVIVYKLTIGRNSYLHLERTK